MGKRFIDTNIFSDEWFGDLSKDGKLFFIYYITNCDHAGVLRLNTKLCKFQTGISNIETVIKELANCMVTVKEGLFFMPKFINYQYPNFPKSNVRQQDSAIKILDSLGLWDIQTNSYLTVSKELPNSYVNDSVSDIVIEDVKEISIEFQKFLNWVNSFGDKVQKLKEPFTEPQALNIIESINKGEYSKKDAEDIIIGMQNKKDLLTKYNSAYLTFLSWLRKRTPTEPTLKRKTL